MNGPVAAAKLVSMLLLAIAEYTGFAVPKQHPEISFLSQSELQVRFCGWPCPIHAFFPPGSTIYLEQGLNVFQDPASESILVHELTHWMQQANLPHPVAQSCQEWLDREYQAFDVQYRWLRDASPNIGIFSIEMAKLNHGPLVASCPSVDSGQPTGLSDSALAKSPPSRAGTLAGYGG
jgi:hypothetical protein